MINQYVVRQSDGNKRESAAEIDATLLFVWADFA
jgi:hypothetical protein